MAKQIKQIGRCTPLANGSYRVLEHSGIVEGGVAVVCYDNAFYSGELVVSFRPNTKKVDEVIFKPSGSDKKSFQEKNKKLSGRML
jgi:hypothetical protein